MKGFFKRLSKATPAVAKTCLELSEKKKTQYKLTSIPIVNKEKETITLSKDDKTTEIISYDGEVSSITSVETSSTATISTTIDQSATELAQRSWGNDHTVHNNLNHVVEWIRNGKASSNSILQSYMAHFDFQDLKLEQAFRNLCSKLHLKVETQQIDRVLVEFSSRYIEYNPHCIFGSVGK